MSINRVGRWGGNRTGGLYYANTPDLRIGQCEVEPGEITLPSGETKVIRRRTPVANFLDMGSLAVAIKHSGDCFNTYIPVTLERNWESGGLDITPFLDIEFGAYSFGIRLARLGEAETRQIAAGVVARYEGELALTAR